MKRRLRLALAQMNPVVGDLDGNVRAIIEWIDRARAAEAEVVVFPELALTGYPPEDLLLKPQFVDANLAALDRVIKQTRDIAVVVGFVDREDDIFNAAAVASNGQLAGVYRKMYLPNYGVFDEFRYFQAGGECPVFQIADATVGVSICEDIWYPDGPFLDQAFNGGAEVLINISSSPFHAGKRRWRERMLATRAGDSGAIVAYLNTVGGQDELVFDGDSLVFNEYGNLIARGKQFEEELIVTDLDIEAVFRRRLRDPRRRQRKASFAASAPRPVPTRPTPQQPLPARLQPELLSEDAEIYRALVVGTRDYIRKNGFKKVLLGLSGGIDSALTACIAVDALGRSNVVGVLMPSTFSSQGSLDDAEALGKSLGIELVTMPITPVFEAYKTSFRTAFQTLQPGAAAGGVAEENVQARIRGNYLMAISNQFGWLVLSTGNKSEISVGYCTLYGDMAGGFAALKDVMKTTVYRLARYVNELAPGRIPQSSIDKPPSAELRPDQLDTDSLPPYEELDPILRAYVEEERSLEEIVRMGVAEELAQRVIRLVDVNEYKRRQAAPGVKITPLAFGRDRRMPITNRFR
ncbi:MAG TPA: NAD+ synthase [Terriglobia bacterium]|nr:NAD+ synthase [Terriglobia bacterium]